jgi:hypothetical protein
MLNENLVNYITNEVIKRFYLLESYNYNNFYENTYAVFKGCKEPSREPDYTSRNGLGYVSSCYWYTNEGVYRSSGHWSEIYVNGERVEDLHNGVFECGNVASCWWILECDDDNINGCGFCKWADFE